VNQLARDSLILKAAVEFGPDYTYDIKNGTLGPTLVIDAETKERASIIRAKVPTDWEGLYTIVVYYKTEPFEEDGLYDPKLT
tara:strand:- start:418 stop:663 length:246 start_codon:yes stop_codon:yes gene_type:complete